MDDSDGDGIPDYLDTDSDGDGISDADEGTEDTDGDGVEDYLDTDSDNDGVSDADEGTQDSDNDGIPDYQDDDSGGEETEEEDPCAASFTMSNGHIVVEEAADVTFKVLGSHSRYGSRGPEIQVRLSASVNGGATWQSLYGFRDVDGAETQTIPDVPADSEIQLKVEGRYGWLFRRRVRSTDTTGRIYLLRRGDALPGTTPFANPFSLRRFLRNVVRSGQVHIDQHSVLALVELQDLTSTSDFQDAVVEIIFEKPQSQGICGAATGDDDDDVAGDDDTGDDDDDVPTGNEITICHYPPGNRLNPQTIEIDESAWPAHKAIGDRLGACEEDDDGDTISNGDDLCPNTYMPERVPYDYILFNRYALTQGSHIFRNGPRKKVGRFTLADTKGCSCEQLVDVAEGKRLYHFNQYPRLQRRMRSLFPFFTVGARNHGCSKAIINMVRKSQLQ